MKKKTLQVVFLFSIFTFGLLGMHLNAQATMPFDPQKAVASGDHKALAEYYRSLAQEQKNVAEMHKKMKATYKEGNYAHYKGYENAMDTHCYNLIHKSLEMSAEYEKMAQMHEEMAKKKK